MVRGSGSETPADPSKAREIDLGFGAIVARESRRRFLNRDGTFNVAKEGLGFWDSIHLYDLMMKISWPRLLLLVIFFFLAINGLFATTYYLLGPGALEGSVGTTPGLRFLSCFFFSVETLSTIGYGNIAPVTVAAHLVVVSEALVGFLSVAVAAGIIFARFSRPQARIIFSRSAVIAPYEGTSAFMFRIANQKQNQLINLQCKVLFARRKRDEPSKREFTELALERSSVVFFPLSWTVVHPITESSPLVEYTPEDLLDCDAEFLILLTGFDETSSQTVHARSSYKGAEVVYGAKFASIFNPLDGEGRISVNINRLHEVEPATIETRQATGTTADPS